MVVVLRESLSRDMLTLPCPSPERWAEKNFPRVRRIPKALIRPTNIRLRYIFASNLLKANPRLKSEGAVIRLFGTRIPMRLRRGIVIITNSG